MDDGKRNGRPPQVLAEPVLDEKPDPVKKPEVSVRELRERVEKLETDRTYKDVLFRESTETLAECRAIRRELAALHHAAADFHGQVITWLGAVNEAIKNMHPGTIIRPARSAKKR